jgi:hypothetical protein
LNTDNHMTMPKPRRWLAIAGFFFAIAFALVFVNSASGGGVKYAQQSAISLVALTYEGTYQGECWPFVGRVISEATGKTIGFDYREGFFEAGAVEVSIAEARSGDIIQIINDAYTLPDADYPGMHTAIVLENLGGGLFTVIDSNSQWDGRVRVRSNYDPAAAAARFGIHFHIYRIGGDSQVPLEITTPGGPGPEGVGAGDVVRVNTGGDCLNLRAEPGLAGGALACLTDGSLLAVTGSPVNVGGRSWLPVLSGFGEGWVALSYVERPDGSAPASGIGSTASVLPFRSYVPMIASSN